MREHAVPYSIGHDTGNRIALLYGVERTPTTFFLARDGNVAAIRVGTIEPERLAGVLEQLLKAQ